MVAFTRAKCGDDLRGNHGPMRSDHSLNDCIQLVRDLLGVARIDFAAAMALLNTMPLTIQSSTAQAVGHARLAVAAAPGGDHRHEAIARYTLARVLVALESESSGVGSPIG